MILETERIICRDFRYNDFEDIHSYGSSTEVVKYMAWGPNTEEDSRVFMNEAIECITDDPRLRYELAIIDKKLDAFVGGVAIYIISEDSRVGEIGYSINPKYWNNGYATEAAKAVIEYGFRKLELHRIQATCDVRNTGSSHVLEKAGMTREGKIREHILLRDGWRDSYMYSILENEVNT